MWEVSWRLTELQHIDPHSYGHNSISFPFSWAAQPGAWGPSLSATCSSFQHLLSNWLNILCTELYNNLTSTLPASVTISPSIQPVHGQDYILIFLDRMHLLFTQVHFLFWQLGRGQYVTRVWWAIVTVGIINVILCRKHVGVYLGSKLLSKQVWLNITGFLFKIFNWRRSVLSVIFLMSRSSWRRMCPIVADALSTISLVILRGFVWLFAAVSLIWSVL